MKTATASLPPKSGQKTFSALDSTKGGVVSQLQTPGKYDYVYSKDRYVGDLDPVTKLRHGEGVYTFENPFFQYKGQYVNGTKEGQGVLLLRDGSRYEGQFSDGEITGTGERVYADGNIYRGEFQQGERHGYGEMEYNAPRAKEVWYKG